MISIFNMWKFLDMLLGQSSEPKPTNKPIVQKKVVEVVGPRACMRSEEKKNDN